MTMFFVILGIIAIAILTPAFILIMGDMLDAWDALEVFDNFIAPIEKYFDRF